MLKFYFQNARVHLITKDISFRKSVSNYGALLFGAAYAAPNKGTTILYRFRPPETVLNPLANGKIQELSRPLSVSEVLFRANFIFKDFSRVLYIQVLFKPEQTPSTD